MNTKYIIQDWAGNVCFNGKKFSDFDDAWGFINEYHRNVLNLSDEEIESEHYYDDYSVELA